MLNTMNGPSAAAAWFAQPGRIEMRYVGNEGEPVVIVDAASGDPTGLIDVADRTGFAPAATVGSGYPGLLGPAPIPYLNGMVGFVLPLIARYFGTGAVMPARARGNFSLVTTPADQLTEDQRMPHVDTEDRLQFATVHFLSPDNGDGTGFFRHRATGFETIDAARVPTYRHALDAELPGQAGNGYRTGSDALFDLIGAVEARLDRLVLYRASLLHSGLISRVGPDAADPRRGRLTGNLFLQCRTPA